jgi:hypothetical protein
VAKGDGEKWLSELTQAMAAQLRASQDDRTRLWEAVNRIRENHSLCREEILKTVAVLDKRTEIIAVKVGVYVSIISSAIAVLAQHLAKGLWG